MKQTIKLTESELRNMIAESLKRVIKEEMENPYRQVPNLNDYIQQKGLQMQQAYKFQRINARPAQEGERITTIASDGVGETTNVAGQGDWVVNNVSNPDNQWIIDGKTFAKKYVPVNGQQGVYMPKGGPMNAAQINEPISFTAPWGETMNIDKGGYILQDPTNPNDIYGISGKDFDNTYKFNENKTIYNSNILENKQYNKNRNMKQTIRLRESELKRIISESVKRTINEVGDTPKGQYMLGRAAARNRNRSWSQYHKGASDQGADMLKRAETLGQHAMSKLKDDKDVSVFSELLGDLYNFISSFCSTKMSEDDYEQLMYNVEEYSKDIYRLIKQKTDELASKPYHQGYSD